MNEFAIRSETVFNERYPGLLQYLKMNDCDTVDKVAIHVAKYCMADKKDQEEAIEITELAYMLLRWKAYRMIYRLDTTLTEELLEQAKRISEDESLPCDLIRNLPYPCIAVSAAPYVMNIKNDDGSLRASYDFSGEMFITFSEKCELFQWPALSTLCEDTKGCLHSYYFPLIQGKTLDECLDTLLEYFNENSDVQYDKETAVIEAIPSLFSIQVLLYLASDQADVEKRPMKKPNKKVKSRNKAVKPPQIVHVGYHIGSTLRAARAKYDNETANSGTGSKKRPHSRRAHWHRYWVGSHKEPEKRKLVVKWIPPVFIHADEGDNLPTIIPVK